MKEVYLITTIEEYGKLIAYCIEHDIQVFRTYWDESAKGNRCYHIDYSEKRCYYSSKEYYIDNGYAIVVPKFYFNKYGTVCIKG